MSDQYSDDQFVYVDPDTRTVVGLVQWSADGEPVALERKPKEPLPQQEGKDRKPPRKRYYPWGTYSTMNRIYRLEGKKEGAAEDYITLDTAVAKLQEEPFWNN